MCHCLAKSGNTGFSNPNKSSKVCEIKRTMAGPGDTQAHLAETVTGRDLLDHVPHHGYRVKLDHKFSKKGKPFTTPRLHQLPSFIGLSLR